MPSPRAMGLDDRSPPRDGSPLAHPPTDLASPFADPDVEPLPGDEPRDLVRIGDSNAVDRDAAALDESPAFALRWEDAGVRQQRVRAVRDGLRREREPVRGGVEGCECR